MYAKVGAQGELVGVTMETALNLGMDSYFGNFGGSGLRKSLLIL